MIYLFKGNKTGEILLEDKTFELLERMYSELLEFKRETNEKLNDVKGHILRIENDHGQKLNVLLDGYKQNAEGITEINGKLDKLTDRVENQEIKLQVLKSAK
jgi:uncharacterized protein YaaR (DUF327 family)